MGERPSVSTTPGQESLLDHDIVKVERAAADLRCGRPVLVTAGGERLLLAAAELVSDRRLDQFRALSAAPPVAGLTYNRANILKISPRSGDVALVEITRRMDCATLHSMADPADDLSRPLLGPYQVAARPAGPAHAAGLKLCKIARLLPAAVFSGPVAPDALEGQDILEAESDAVMGYDLRDAAALSLVTSAHVPLAGAEQTTMVAFRPEDGGTEHFAILIGDPNRHDPVLARIHSECFTGDLLGSLKCDCGEQMRGAVKFMQQAGGGVLLYLAQEGRGIGLINKLRAYHLQDQGFDTVDANERLGFLSDERIFEPAARMLDLMGFARVRLLTNNPDKVAGLEACGITVTERVTHKFPANAHNDFYLRTKKKRSGHLL